MKSRNIKPRYYVAWSSSHDVTADMLYAVYAEHCFYADGGSWQFTGLHPRAFQAGGVCQHYSPCSLVDVRAAFDNIKAPKRSNVSLYLGMTPAYM